MLPVKAMVISDFRPGAGKLFGRLEFMGGLSLATPKGEMGAVSSIRLVDGGKRFISVMDTGHWATGAIDRDAKGALSGVSDYRIYDMLGRNGRPATSSIWTPKAWRSTRTMSMSAMRAIIGSTPIARPGFETAKPLSTERPVLTAGRLKNNGGMETLLKAPDDSALKALSSMLPSAAMTRRETLSPACNRVR